MLYQHFKGGLYLVLDETALDATNHNVEPERDYVIYRALTGESTGRVFIREQCEFHENVEHDGRTGPRFRVIADSADIMLDGGHP